MLKATLKPAIPGETTQAASRTASSEGTAGAVSFSGAAGRSAGAAACTLAEVAGGGSRLAVSPRLHATKRRHEAAPTAAKRVERTLRKSEAEAMPTALYPESTPSPIRCDTGSERLVELAGKHALRLRAERQKRRSDFAKG